jgi:hypothetical protein
MNIVVGKLFKRVMHLRNQIFIWCIVSFINWDKIISCILYDEFFYAMHVITIIITCTFLKKLKEQERKFGSYMRTRAMEDAQRSYSHQEEIIGLDVTMVNAKTKSNGRRDRQEPVTMRSLHREVQHYRDDNERIMKDQEEILQSLNMLHKQVNK